jgi:hypothetical protein
MKKGLLTAVVSLLACAGLARAGDEPTSGDYCWIEGDYLIWHLQGLKLPPLVTTGTPSLVPQTGSGILGQPGTQVLIGGDNRISEPWLQGGQVTAGWWCDCDHTLAVEGGFFGLFQKGKTQAVASDDAGNPVLSRPIFDVRSNQQAALFVSSPGAFAAPEGVTVDNTISMLGAEANLVWVTEHFSQPYWNLITGVRYLYLREGLEVAQQSQVLPLGVTFFNNVPLGTATNVRVGDDFVTANNFIGANLGARWGFDYCGFYFNVVTKVALGGTRESVDVFGSTTVTPPGGPSRTAPGGLLAVDSNAGHHSRTRFAVLPEADATVAYDLTCRVRLVAGYSILAISDVLRPGGAIDPAVNRSLVPTSQVYNPAASQPAQPAPSLTGVGFWAHGATVGLEVSY